MHQLPTLTFVATNIDLLDLDTLYSLVGVSKSASPHVNVVFVEDAQFSSHKIRDKARYRFLFQNEEFQDGSATAALFDEKSQQTVFLVIAESGAVFDDARPRVMASHAPNARFVVACRPFMAPLLMDVAARFAFVHMPAYDESALESSTTYALTKLQGQQVGKTVRPQRNVVRQLRRRVSVKLREKTSDLAEFEKMVATEFLSSADSMDKLTFSPPFAVRGFNVSSSNARELDDYTLILGPMMHHAIFGPYLRIPAGNYRAGWLLEVDDANGEAIVIVDVAAGGNTVAGTSEVIQAGQDGPEWLWLDFSLGGDSIDNVEFRLTPVNEQSLRLHKIEVQSI
jgi:hypothetical protein